MGRKSKKARMLKPFCYFCLREFDNEKVLIQHQKAKHFKCSECNRKLETANGLMVHMQQVHKMAQRRVPNSLEGRDNINSSIQGMNGVPPEVIEEHRMQHFQRLNSLNNQKQQRINWTQVHAPGFTNLVNPNLMNVNFQNNNTQTTTVQSNNFTTTVTSTSATTNNLLNEDTFTADASEEMMSNANKLLILDPNGMPIYQQVQTPTQQNQPTTTTTQSPLFLLQQQNKLVHKPSFGNLGHSGFDSGVQTYLPNTTASTTTTSFTTATTPTQFSDRVTVSGVGLTSLQSSSSSSFSPSAPTVLPTVTTTTVTLTTSTAFGNDHSVLNKENNGVKEQDDPNSSSATTNNLLNEDTFTTVHYKVTGLQPLYIPTPSLGNTKLSYTSDSVSIEELRAKVKYNWHETPT